MSEISAGTTTAEVIPTGNTYDKYGSTNPVVKRLMTGFHRQMDELLSNAAPASIVDVGCGEGVLTEQWAERLGDGRVVGIDLADPKLSQEWAKRRRANLEFITGQGDGLPFADGEFEIATAMEVLEHVPDPGAVLGEMARVSSKWMLVSVPREPLWRGLNMARGAYLKGWGNTPGHLNHWSKRSFAALLRNYGEVVELCSPFPWTMALIRAS
ncbi:MAG: methyltransferase domain-containing protein [Dehalococcoidia bacterium]